MKRKKLILIVLILATGLLYGNADRLPASLSIENPLDFSRHDVFVEFPCKGLSAMPLCLSDGTVDAVPTQVLDHDGDGVGDALALLCDLPASGSVDFRMNDFSDPSPAFAVRTQAVLSVKDGGHWEGHAYVGGRWTDVKTLVKPPQHDVHSWFIRMEGPALESDRVAYRFYFDRRNGYDIFGKHNSAMVLQQVGLDNDGSYHNDSDWGMDILKVGDALGIGAEGWWDGSQVQLVSDTTGMRTRVLNNGPIYSSIETVYEGWLVGGKRTDLTTRLSIRAGSRLVHVEANSSLPLGNLCTGIVKAHADGMKKFHSDDSAGLDGWGYLATWGRQSLNGDMLGLVIFYPVAALGQRTEDKLNDVIVLKGDGPWEYYLGAAWEGESGGISTENDFLSWCDRTVRELSNPPVLFCSR